MDWRDGESDDSPSEPHLWEQYLLPLRFYRQPAPREAPQWTIGGYRFEIRAAREFPPYIQLAYEAA